MRIACSLLLVLTACGGAVAESDPIALELGKLQEGDIDSNAFDIAKSVGDDTGEPYPAFLAAARAELDGDDPESIEVRSIVLTVGADSKGIGTRGFGTLIENLEVYLAKGATTVVVGRRDDVPESTTVDIDIDANPDTLGPLRDALLKGDFEIGVRGDAQPMRPADDYELPIDLRATFEAH